MKTLRKSAYDRLGGYSWNDQKMGLPKQKKIIAALSDEELDATRTDVWRASTDPVFGNANLPIKRLIEDECDRRKIS